MMQSAMWSDNDERDRDAVQTSRRLPFLRFLMRYPIFLLAFGPPIFRPPSTYAGFDTSQAHFDIWSIFQVGWLFVIALRAMIRLSTAQSVVIPKRTRSILKYALFLGLAFLASVAYSPGRIVSAEYSILYLLTLLCVFEFLVDAYQNPPNWILCLFHLRLIALLLLAAILLVLLIAPRLVMSVIQGAGIRLLGGAVAPMAVICPIIAIISAYSFLHALESRVRSTLFFLIGLAGTAATQARGAEIMLLAVLAIIGIGSAKTSKRSAYLFISGVMTFILLSGVVMGTFGGERIWSRFNRGQDSEGIVTLSGRTEVWGSLIQYTMIHPQGLGYIAGVRKFGLWSSSASLHDSLNRVGGPDSTYLEVLADAGWLSLAFYLIMIAKTAALGWRSLKKNALKSLQQGHTDHHAIRCALMLLIFCLGEGIEDTNFINPLRQEFYSQYIILAIILGASVSMLTASRTRNTSFTE